MSCEGTLAPPGGYDSTCASFRPSETTTQMTNQSVHRFCTAYGRRTLYIAMGAPFPKIAPSHRGSRPPSDTWLPDPTRVFCPYGIWIQFSRVCRSHYCDRSTDHAIQSVTIGRIYVSITTMRPNNNVNKVHICIMQNTKSRYPETTKKTSTEAAVYRWT